MMKMKKESDLIPPHYRIVNISREIEQKGIKIIHMELGDPELDTDKRIIDTMYEAALKGHTHYGDARGLPEFRDAVSRYLNRRLKLDLTRDNVCVVPGSKSAIYMSLKTLADGPAKVGVVEPTWGIYYSFIRDLGYDAIPIRLKYENKWQVREEDLKDIGKLDFIAVINPSNPTGVVWDRESIELILEKATRDDAYLIADEIYFELIYSNKKFISFMHYNYEKTVGLYSFSKTFAMTGFRIGWIASYDKDIINRIARGYQLLLTNVPEFIQYAGIKATDLDDVIERNRGIYMERTYFLVNGLKRLGFEFVEPEAGFYIFSKVPNPYNDSYQFALDLLHKARVAIAPGTSFGDYPGFIRFTTALKIETLKEALKNIEEFMKS
ncbi:hypothetical protein DRN84_01560 [Candidatus Geothermarchaeota archaeon]|nr:MAG: hypothetical protein DRN87_01580 [Candidatus Geothermarchaeota archaeon]RLG62568.1 MAG: hypothetical protein DRN84_01560 [Candidatus Geothermarchaeota archaeon]HEW94334.1 pyridoxal phosphate-dependent aminotransferase [Thermoprotei archaeon]